MKGNSIRFCRLAGIWLLVLAFAVSATAIAEETDMPASLDFETLHMVYLIENWDTQLTDVLPLLKSEDSKTLITHILELMPTYSSTVSASERETSQIDLKGDMEEREARVGEVDGLNYVQGGYFYNEYLNRYAAADVACRDNYCKIDYLEYTDEGKLYGLQSLELARRENGELLVLFIDYDAEYMATGRYAMWKNEDEDKCIFTKTFGLTLDVNLDVEAWAQGSESIEWSDALLYAPTT